MSNLSPGTGLKRNVKCGARPVHKLYTACAPFWCTARKLTDEPIAVGIRPQK